MDSVKQRKINLVFYLMVNCDMMEGRICDMPKEIIDDTWYEKDLDNIIRLARKLCSKIRRERKC